MKKFYGIRLMQMLNAGSILIIFIKSCYKRQSFRSYNKMTIINAKLSLNFCIKVLARGGTGHKKQRRIGFRIF